MKTKGNPTSNQVTAFGTGEEALQRTPQSKKAHFRLVYGRSSDSPPIRPRSLLTRSIRAMALLKEGGQSDKTLTRIASGLQRLDRPGVKPEFPVPQVLEKRARTCHRKRGINLSGTFQVVNRISLPCDDRTTKWI